MNDEQKQKRTGRVSAMLRTPGSSDEWYTPPAFIKALGEFDLDPACGPLCKNRTAHRMFRSGGLEKPWFGRVWLNPPFSDVRPWVEKMRAHGNGILLVCGRVDAVWFQEAVREASGCFLIKGRVQFNRPNVNTGRCPLGCCLLPFGRKNARAIRKSGLPGLFVFPDLSTIT